MNNEINMCSAPICLPPVNYMIVKSFGMEISWEQWVAWNQLLLECRSKEEPLASLFDLYRSLPVIINKEIPKGEIWFVNQVDRTVLGKITNLALPVEFSV